VANKSKCRRRIKNVFIDARGFPNQSDKFDVLLHNIEGGPVLRKLKHPPPPLGVVDPMFSFPYNELIHGARLWKDLNLLHLDALLQQTVYNLIIKYWSVFDERGIFVPV
jgi:hypothetical protein